MPKWYEWEVALYVEADTEQEALDKMKLLVEEANRLDPEGDAQVKCHGYVDA